LGSQAFGKVVGVTAEEGRFKVGDRVAVGMYRFACANCRECHKGRDDLCKQAQFTSSSTIGGYATFIDVSSDWAYPVPNSLPD
jgi:D-arabinose 1-dehydrogenase-like Zn-dependent alcohol dehydrogenase